MNCPICTNFSSSFEDTLLNKIYFFCSHCEAIFLDPKFYLDNETEKSKYTNHNNSIENEGYVKMFEDFMDFFWEDLDNKNNLAALDFGCGPGPVLACLLERKGLHVDKYDPYFYPTKIQKEKKFSLITSTEVFEHLQKPMDIFLDLTQSLRDDGLLALMTLFHKNDKKVFLQWWYRRDPTHIIFYTPKTFEYMAKKNGMKIKRCDDKRLITFKKK